jgi:hypothetical protein
MVTRPMPAGKIINTASSDGPFRNFVSMAKTIPLYQRTG